MNVTRNDHRRRFEVTVDGHTGVLTYREAAGHVTLIHTEVPPELRGRGIADALARAALDDARQRGLPLRPLCTRSTWNSWLRRCRPEDDGTECGGSLGRHASRGQGPGQARQRRVRGPIRRVVEHVPTILVRHGRILQANLASERLSLSEFHAALRREGIVTVRGLRYVLLEQDGHLSVIR